MKGPFRADHVGSLLRPQELHEARAKAKRGEITPQQLREGRGYAIVGVFVIAALITPPDVVSQLMLAIPMCLLYELGIVAAGWLKPRPVEP